MMLPSSCCVYENDFFHFVASGWMWCYRIFLIVRVFWIWFVKQIKQFPCMQSHIMDDDISIATWTHTTTINTSFFSPKLTALCLLIRSVICSVIDKGYESLMVGTNKIALLLFLVYSFPKNNSIILKMFGGIHSSNVNLISFWKIKMWTWSVFLDKVK